MIKCDNVPAALVVTGSARTAKVTGRGGVTGLAVGQALMRQLGVFPRFCVVALGTRPREVPTGCAVAVGAVGAAIMGEPDLGPIIDVVAGRTLAGFMWFWCDVTAHAIIKPVVVKPDFVPGVGAMA